MVIMDINWQKNNSFLLSTSNQKLWGKASLNWKHQNRYCKLTSHLAFLSIKKNGVEEVRFTFVFLCDISLPWNYFLDEVSEDEQSCINWRNRVVSKGISFREVNLKKTCLENYTHYMLGEKTFSNVKFFKIDIFPQSQFVPATLSRRFWR